MRTYPRDRRVAAAIAAAYLDGASIASLPCVAAATAKGIRCRAKLGLPVSASLSPTPAFLASFPAARAASAPVPSFSAAPTDAINIFGRPSDSERDVAGNACGATARQLSADKRFARFTCNAARAHALRSRRNFFWVSNCLRGLWRDRDICRRRQFLPVLSYVARTTLPSRHFPQCVELQKGKGSIASGPHVGPAAVVSGLVPVRTAPVAATTPKSAEIRFLWIRASIAAKWLPQLGGCLQQHHQAPCTPLNSRGYSLNRAVLRKQMDGNTEPRAVVSGEAGAAKLCFLAGGQCATTTAPPPPPWTNATTEAFLFSRNFLWCSPPFVGHAELRAAPSYLAIAVGGGVAASAAVDAAAAHAPRLPAADGVPSLLGLEFNGRALLGRGFASAAAASSFKTPAAHQRRKEQPQQNKDIVLVHAVKIPPLGDSVTRGNVLEWRKKVGDPVQLDEVLCVIETDKVTVEIHSDCEGIVVAHAAAEGESLNVDDDLALVQVAGEEVHEPSYSVQLQQEDEQDSQQQRQQDTFVGAGEVAAESASRREEESQRMAAVHGTTRGPAARAKSEVAAPGGTEAAAGQPRLPSRKRLPTICFTFARRKTRLSKKDVIRRRETPNTTTTFTGKEEGGRSQQTNAFAADVDAPQDDDPLMQ